MENMNEQVEVLPLVEDQAATSTEHNQCDVYQLSTAKLSRNKQKLERRQFKGQISDRRSTVRLDVDGDPQRDRREINRLAHAEMFSRFKQIQ